MKAVVVDSESHALSWSEVDDPSAAPGGVVMSVRATAVNRADLLQRAGQYPVPPGASPYMGLEASGVIYEIGEGVEGWSVGDRVCSLLAGGGYAERVATPASLLVRIPDAWSFEQAAAVPEVFYTAYVNLFVEGQLAEGETLLIHGGASGVGTAGIQMATRAGVRVIAVVGREDKAAFCCTLGADVAINRHEVNFADAVKKAAPDGVDVILDIGAADYLSRNLACLRNRGRLVIIALLGGAIGEVDLGEVMRRRLRIIGSVLRSRSLEEKEAIREGFEDRFWKDLVSGAIQPVIDRTLTIEEVESAQEVLTRNENIGKVIMTIPV
ncbi:MAG: NADPH:quinone oxidoreductase [Gemmatimonadetes bacterium]|nr:NADPH:quinone oxidoreductase [Gemmatimonadota bacterium]|tara:strand:- start:474 stop:1448 length:975 start_codon:yes stop_codon:yes gene_type:complete